MHHNETCVGPKRNMDFQIPGLYNQYWLTLGVDNVGCKLTTTTLSCGGTVFPVVVIVVNPLLEESQRG
ncbi:hypothetical protein L873DRAFT_1812461 [Choiromyces venosus 120613-1]|uniref:Uncharacterized protein n=1 Tax=Choiromyces venosus 120613-1 TaxID=1336337 RepID=A0A3N4JP69_9PEZI|nr:hypothetical protein L873DRAFT_1812461 [Choiromyces venosus 120613-1]